MTPKSWFLDLGPHEMHVTEWGRADAPVLVLWHGLARTGRDFDELAAALADSYRVLCPDTIGRGLSSWSADPGADYCLDRYAAHALALLDAAGAGRALWLGTSMGGLIGMRIAAGPAAGRLSGLVINDIGPELPPPAVERIVTYASSLPRFARVTEAEAWLRRVYAPFGPAEAPFWQRMAETSLRRMDDGALTLHYDPAILAQFSLPGEFDNWQGWERITMPCHLIWGRQSDLLLAPIVERMRTTGPRPGLTVYEDCGHAPSLSGPEAIAATRALLAGLARG